MKVVILAGGFGSRLSEYTETIPKPMVRIGGVPILIHIMNTESQLKMWSPLHIRGIALNFKKQHTYQR